MTVTEQRPSRDTPRQESHWDIPQLPVPRDWSVRYGGCPWLDGGMEDQVERLRDALEAIRVSDGAFSTELSPSDDSVRTVAWFSRRLGSSGLLVSNGQGHVKVSDDAARWLLSHDDRILAGILHSRVLLFGEILQLLSDNPGITHSQLKENATSKYKLDWKMLDPVRKRVGWLRSLGYVQFSFDKKLSVTETGLEVLALLDIVDPNQVSRTVERPNVPVPDLPVAIGEEMKSLTSEELSERKSAFGYVPRSNVKDIYESIRHLCLLFDPASTKDQFIASCRIDFGVKDTSGMSALYALKSMGLIEQFSMDGYRLTSQAREWIDSDQPWGLIAIVHAHILIVGELIPYLAEVTRVPNLRETVNGAYGTRLSLSEIRSRIHLLVSCSAVEQLAPGQYRATPEGLAILDQLTLLAERDVPVDVPHADDDLSMARNDSLREELIVAATNSQHPERFELAVQQCFETLGFRSEHLGGPGKTDVLVHYADGPGQTRRFIADAKSSASGTVTETMVQFPALKDHTTKHKADFAVLVAPDFSGRIISWAAENNVVLLNVPRLCVLLENQQRNPAPLDEVIAFLGGKKDGWLNLESTWRAQQRTGDLFVEVIDCLRREYEDPDDETGGALTAEQIYFVLRDAVEPRPTQVAIKPLLDFLSSPLAQGTRPAGKGWRLPDPPTLIARRLRTIAARIDAINEAD